MLTCFLRSYLEVKVFQIDPSVSDSTQDLITNKRQNESPETLSVLKCYW